MPVVDEVSADYTDRVAFLAPAWKGTLADTAEQADALMPSGNIMWGLDESQDLFSSFGVPYQPATVLIGADGTVVESWLGARGEDAIRQSLDNLLES